MAQHDLVITNALQDRPVPVYGDGRNVRDWLYVEDHADALLLVLEKPVMVGAVVSAVGTPLLVMKSTVLLRSAPSVL